MALLELLAGAAPAWVVAANLLVLVEHALFHLDGLVDLFDGVGRRARDALGDAARRRRGERARLLGALAAVVAVAGRRGARRAAARRPARAALGRLAATRAVLALDLHLDVED